MIGWNCGVPAAPQASTNLQTIGTSSRRGFREFSRQIARQTMPAQAAARKKMGPRYGRELGDGLVRRRRRDALLSSGQRCSSCPNSWLSASPRAGRFVGCPGPLYEGRKPNNDNSTHTDADMAPT